MLCLNFGSIPSNINAKFGGVLFPDLDTFLLEFPIQKHYSIRNRVSKYVMSCHLDDTKFMSKIYHYLPYPRPINPRAKKVFMNSNSG